ncbi:MAG: hypothetical protein R3D44_06340 [Hyphomicrobiaceae bacterium]
MVEAKALRIDALGAQGDGVTHERDAPIHVPLALPGEDVTRDGAGGFRIVSAVSPARRDVPLCQHFPRCGGCSVQHMSDALYVDWKQGLLAAALAQRGLDVPVSTMVTVPPGSRRRATFSGVWVGEEVRLGFHGRHSHDLEPIIGCAVLTPSIVAALPHLARLATLLIASREAFRVAVLAADNGLDVVFEAKPPPRKALAAGTELAALMRAAKAIRLSVGRVPVLTLGEPVVTIAGVAVKPPANAFFQAASEADELLARHVMLGVGKARRVTDLFSGLGTLSFALARRSRVLAVDSDTELLDALGRAKNSAQGLKPIERLRRDLFRDPLSPRELERADVVVLDPPRAGAAAQCERLAQSKVRRVVMVSCNPATLARDLRTLVDGGFVLEQATPIDQFLFTHHLEAVATLRRP